MAIVRVFAITFVLSLLTFQLTWGETALDRQGDIIRPGAEYWEGVLERVIVENGQVISVIINDAVYRIDEETVVKNAHGGSSSFSRLKTGTDIQFYALDGLLTKVMPALNSEKDGNVNVNALPTPANNSDPVHLENGVWKN